MKLTNKQKQDIASKIPDEYDYMDSLSSGWKWEFLRRNKKYIEAFNNLEQSVKSGDWNDGCEKILSELQGIASSAGLLIGKMSCVLKDVRAKFLILKLPPFKGHMAIGNKYFGSSHHVDIVPRPQARYCDLGGLMFIPKMQGYKIYESFKDLQNNAKISYFSFSEEKFLPPGDYTKDFFYIAVSKNTDIADLRKKLLKSIATILNKHKKQQRARENEWKYYLIVYDLKQRFKDKISYGEIADILNDAYPEANKKDFTETRNINTWHKSATSLIKGDFIKNIKHKTKSPTK